MPILLLGGYSHSMAVSSPLCLLYVVIFFLLYVLFAGSKLGFRRILKFITTPASTGFDRVIKTTRFLADMGDFAAFNEVYARYFTSKPARSCVAMKDLLKGVACEIEAIAVK